MEPSNMKSGKPRKLGRVCILWRMIGQPGDGEHSLRWSGENSYIGGDQCGTANFMRVSKKTSPIGGTPHTHTHTRTHARTHAHAHTSWETLLNQLHELILLRVSY